MYGYRPSLSQSYSLRCLVLLFLISELLNNSIAIISAQKYLERHSRVSQDSAALDEEAMKLIREGFRLHDEGSAESLRAAVEILDRAYSITLRTGNRTYQGLALLRMAESAFALGDLAKALTTYRKLLQLCEATDNAYGAASAQASIGDVYSLLGEQQKALASYQKAEAIFTDVKVRREKARVLSKIGRLHAQLRDKEAASVSYRRALTVYGDMVERLSEGSLYLEVGDLHQGLGDSQKAMFYFEKAYVFFKGLGYYRREEAATLVKIATVLSGRGRASQALDRYLDALTIQSETGDLVAEADTLGKIMQFHRKNGKDNLAVWFGKQSVNLYQDLRTNLRRLNAESHKGFVRTVESHYRLLSDTLIQQDRLAEAIQVLVLFKDQNFFDVFRAAQPAPATPAARLVLNERESKLAVSYDVAASAARDAGNKLALLNLRIGDGNPTLAEMEQHKRLESKSREAADALRVALGRVQVELSLPPEPTGTIATTEQLSEMQSALRDLKRGTGETTVALYTLLTEEVYHVLLVTPESIKPVSRHGRAAVVQRTANQLFNLLRSPQFDPRPKARELYNEIFQPLEAELVVLRPDTLLWSLDSSLRYIPMASLFDGERYLVERYRHIVFTRNNRERLTAVPSLPWSRAQGMGSTQQHTVEIFGDKVHLPALPGVQQELDGIFGRRAAAPGGVLTGTYLLNGEFTSEALQKAGRQFQVIHIASHFRFLAGDEEASFLLLGNGGKLSLAEMQALPDLFAGVELLVLSACETATEQADASGREIDGFSEMAQRLGAGSVIATLWRISDASTPDLMIEFYRQRQAAAGMTKAKSLQAAQLIQLRPAFGANGLPPSCAAPANQADAGSDRRRPYPAEAVCAHPYFWAGFVLSGNGR